MIKLKCLCCDQEEEFESDEAAYEKGWDTPRFPIHPVCPACPSSRIIVLGLEKARERHHYVHESWKTSGKPKVFDLEMELLIDAKMKDVN